MKKTAIIGASPNPMRYSYMAAHRLRSYGHPIILLGTKKGDVMDQEIVDIRSNPRLEDVHTVTMYVGPQHQGLLEKYLLSLEPKRIIFNPGTENPAFEQEASNQGIEVLRACTLVMLSANQY